MLLLYFFIFFNFAPINSQRLLQDRCIETLFLRYDECLANLQISERDENCWLDLVPYMHKSPHRVPLSASLPSIFHLFRGLGLRYVVVVDDENKVAFLCLSNEIYNFLIWRMFSTWLCFPKKANCSSV